MESLRAAWAQMTWSRPLLFLFGLDMAWVMSLFLAPATIAPHTFAFRDEGRANIVDFWGLYSTDAFNWYAKVIYVIGDIECHQLASRSLWINGNQMPVCARDASLFLFGLFGMFWAMMTPAAITASAGIVNAFPPRIQRWARRIGPVRFTALVLVLGLLPIAVDGFVQLFQAYTQYESTNAMRILTGAPAGLVAGLLLGMMVKALKQFRIEHECARALASRAGIDAPPREASGTDSSTR